MVNSKNPLRIFIRNWAVWSAQLIPSWKRWLELGPRADGPIRYTHSPGMPFLPEFGGGSAFPQTYCTALPEPSPVQFTDDVIFANGKCKIFQIVVLLSRLDELKFAADDLNGIDRISDHLSPGEATFFILRKLLPESPNSERHEGFDSILFRSATADEFAQSDLCFGRPRPREYNEALMWESVARKRYVILRPDRFVFAACDTKAELIQAARALAALFPLGVTAKNKV